jgi:hypothetical protein
MNILKALLILVLAGCLAACGVDISIPGSIRLPATASRTPRIVVRTPVITATASMTPMPLPSFTPTVRASSTPTPGPPRLELSILGCETSIDFTHQMGEVTNTYVSLSNTGLSAAHNVCAVLSTGDEARPHPDKIGCVLTLPPQTQVTFKLTVDTTFGANTLVQVEASSAESVSASVLGGSCKAIGAPKRELDPLGVIRPIP